MLYLASKSLLLDCIRDNIVEGERLLILAHNPGIDDLVERLSDRPIPLTDSMKLMTTAAIAHFKVDLDKGRFNPSAAKLIQLLRPGD
jgi:phosphohistidine phosphatase